MPDARYLTEMLRQLAQASADAAPLFVLEGGSLRVHSGRLYFVAESAGESPSPAASQLLVWSGEASLPWSGGTLHFRSGDGVGVSRHSLSGMPLTIRRRQGGEALQPDARRPRRALKKLLQESAIPPWQRARMPLLWSGDSLVWVAGIGVDCRHAAKPGEAGVLPIWEPGAAG
jgi:tRNA(Ile)-lysidine synthase